MPLTDLTIGDGWRTAPSVIVGGCRAVVVDLPDEPQVARRVARPTLVGAGSPECPRIPRAVGRTAPGPPGDACTWQPGMVLPADGGRPVALTTR